MSSNFSPPMVKQGYHIEGENFCSYHGFVATCKSFLCKIWGVVSVGSTSEQLKIFLRKIVFSTNSWKFSTIQYTKSTAPWANQTTIIIGVLWLAHMMVACVKQWKINTIQGLDWTDALDIKQGVYLYMFPICDSHLREGRGIDPYQSATSYCVWSETFLHMQLRGIYWRLHLLPDL